MHCCVVDGGPQYTAFSLVLNPCGGKRGGASSGCALKLYSSLWELVVYICCMVLSIILSIMHSYWYQRAVGHPKNVICIFCEGLLWLLGQPVTWGRKIIIIPFVVLRLIDCVQVHILPNSPEHHNYTLRR